MERLGVHYVAEPRPRRRYDPDEHLSRRHLPGKHDQSTHGQGHAKGGNVGGMVKGTDQTEWVAANTRDGYADTPLMQPTPLSDPRDTTLMAIAKQQGFDGKPTVGSIEDTVAAGGVEIFRGSSREVNQKLLSGDYEPATGIYGNGYYFSNKQRVAEHFSKVDIGTGFADVKKRTDGSVVRAALKPGAKVVDYENLTAEMKAWRAEVAPKTQDIGDLYTSDFKTPDGMYSPHMLDYVLVDPGRFAAAKGYDAIKVVGHQDGAPVKKGEPVGKTSQGGRFSANDQYVILNRTALVVEES